LADLVESRRANGWELAMRPEANIVCFRLLPEALGSLKAENDFTLRLRQKHLEVGAHYVVQTRFGGVVWLRCTLMNPLTGAADLNAMLDAFEGLAAGLANQG